MHPSCALLCYCFVILCQNILRCKNFDYMRFRLPLIKKATTFVIAFLVEMAVIALRNAPFVCFAVRLFRDFMPKYFALQKF